MKKVLKIISVILYLACIFTIICGIGVYCINTFSLNGRFIEYLALEPMYYYYEPLVDDYITLLKSDKTAAALSCIDPSLLKYYSSVYRLNRDIILTLDDAYANGDYVSVDSWMIHHTIEWNTSVYQDIWDKLSIEPDHGIDLYVRFFPEKSDQEITYIFEVIQRNGYWYLLSVTPE